jgi:hypothetical protein
MVNSGLEPSQNRRGGVWRDRGEDFEPGLGLPPTLQRRLRFLDPSLKDFTPVGPRLVVGPIFLV